MNQPPIDNQFVQPGCEQFTSDTPKTDLACSGPSETVVARLRELSCGLERQVDRLCRERDNISDFNAGWHKEMTSRNAELELKVIETENELESMRSKFSTMNQPAPSDTPESLLLQIVVATRNEDGTDGNSPQQTKIWILAQKAIAELTRLSAEREKEREMLSRTEQRSEHFSKLAAERWSDLEALRATLAERDRQLAEAEARFKKAKDWNEFCEIEQRLLRSRLEDGDKDLSNAEAMRALELEKMDTLRLALRCLIEQCESGTVDKEAIKRARGLL